MTWVDDSVDKVNALMAEWAADGWELVNGSTSVYRTGDSISRGVHYRYSQYWRRAINR